MAVGRYMIRGGTAGRDRLRVLHNASAEALCRTRRRSRPAVPPRIMYRLSEGIGVPRASGVSRTIRARMRAGNGLAAVRSRRRR